MNKLLIVGAHADDELLWFHPWLLERCIERRVLICCSDRYNPDRQSYAKGYLALEAVCHRVGIENHRILHRFHSEFYKLRTRGPGSGPILRDWWFEAVDALHEMSAGVDAIVSHNPWGEYCNFDHLLVRRMVLENTKLPVFWTDAMVATSTWPMGPYIDRSRGITGEHSTDPAEFASLKEEYVSRGCWTWSSAEPLSVRVMSNR